MPFEITMPQLGLTMETGTIVDWLVREGDAIAPGQEIFEVESDKSVVIVEAHQAGTLARILAPVGHKAPVGDVVAVLIAPGESLPVDWRPRGKAPSRTIVPVASPTHGPLAPAPVGDSRVEASWKARKLARQAGLDLLAIAGSGPGSRIVAADVLQAQSEHPAAPDSAVKASPVAVNLAAALGLDLSAIIGSGRGGRILQADVMETAADLIRRAQAIPRPAQAPGAAKVAATTPLRGVRRIVSERMATSARNTARVTLFRSVDASGLMALRERFKVQGAPISYNDILVHVCAIALREHPAANSRLGDGRIEHLDCIHIGLAVDTERGLMVPVIHHADELPIRQIAAESARLITAAQAGSSLPDDLAGGTFTITNLGMFGVERFTPVINLPECCILGIGRIERKPVVSDEKDTVIVRPMMTLGLVFDHRVIDGAPAARFLARIAELIQDRLLLLTVNQC